LILDNPIPWRAGLAFSTRGGNLLDPIRSSSLSVEEKAEIAERVRLLTDWARETFSFEQAIRLFAVHKVYLDQAIQDHLASSMVLGMTGSSSRSKAAILKDAEILLDSVPKWLKEAVGTGVPKSKAVASNRAKLAADSRHGKPGGSRSKADAIRKEWASGKFTSRDRCAEEQCAVLDMSFSAARKALRGTPDPT
jgi:hypothetical protein